MIPAHERPSAGTQADQAPFSLRGLVVVIFIAVAAVAGYIWGIAGYQREHDRWQVRVEVQRIEAALRTGHPVRDWIYVEGRDKARSRPRDHAKHEATLRDFERLAHVGGLAFAQVEVETAYHHAVARFRVTGRITAERSNPARGELQFEREREGWVLVESRLYER